MINVIEIEGMKDLIEAIEGSESSVVPTPTSADRGKLLGVKSNADELEYKEINEVPTSTSTDEGKVLTVDSNGDLEWATPSSGLPSYDSSNRNAILKVNDAGTAVQWVDDYNGYHNASLNQNFSYPVSRTLHSWGDGDVIPKYNHIVYAKALQFYDATNDQWTRIERVDLTRFTYFEWSASGITLYCKIAQESVIIDYFKSLGLLDNANTYSIQSQTGHKGELLILW